MYLAIRRRFGGGMLLCPTALGESRNYYGCQPARRLFARRGTDMHRIQLIELHEQPWFPTFLRNNIMDTLQYGLNVSKAYASTAPLLQCIFIPRRTPRLSICAPVVEGRGSISLNDSNAAPQTSMFPLTDEYPNSRASGNAQPRSEFQFVSTAARLTPETYPLNSADFAQCLHRSTISLSTRRET